MGTLENTAEHDRNHERKISFVILLEEPRDKVTLPTEPIYKQIQKITQPGQIAVEKIENEQARNACLNKREKIEATTSLSKKKFRSYLLLMQLPFNIVA